MVKGAEKGEGDVEMKLKSLRAVYVENFRRATSRFCLVTFTFLFRGEQWLE
jgi:hypothetical protein